MQVCRVGWGKSPGRRARERRGKGREGKGRRH